MIPGWRWILVIWMLGLLAGGVVIARAPFSTDMSAFLPRSPRPEQRILVDQLREGVVSHLVLLAIEGAPVETMAALSKAMASDLRGDAAFGVVSNGDEAAFARDHDVLWSNRYLLSPAVTPEHFSTSALHAALEEDARLLGSDMGVLVKRTLPADPTREMLRLVGALGAETHPDMRDGVWFSRDGARALLLARTVAAGFDIDGQERAVHRVEAAFDAARRGLPAESGAARARLIETGPPVFAVRTRAQMKADVQHLSVIATLLVAGVLLFAYRSPRMLVLALLPVLSGAIAGIAAVALAFGFVHGITLGFGVTLIGEAVDYAIYLFTQTAPGSAAAATLPRIWPTLRLGMLTSVCGFSAMLFSGFTGFAQLGLLTITGLIVALAVTRWVLPVLLPVNFPASRSVVFAMPVAALIRASSWLRFVVLGLSLAALVLLVSHRGPYWDDELASMSPLPASDKALDEQLRREIGAPDTRYLLVARAANPEQALEASERVAARLAPLVAGGAANGMANGAIAGFDAPSTWLPSLASQRARQAALPDSSALSASLGSAVEDTAFRPNIFAPFLADVATARQQKLLKREDLDGTSLASRLDALLVPDSGQWLAMLPLRGVTDEQAVGKAMAGFDGLVLLDLKAESDRLLDSYLREALTLSVAGSVVIVVLLSASLRSSRRAAAVLLPLAAAVLCTAAILLTAGGRLSIFNLFGLLLVAAVGSNYCLFFERHAADSGERHAAKSGERHGVDSGDGGRMIASLVIADLCTVIGFGILSFSAFPVLHGIGLTVAIGACLSLLFGAMLSGGQGWLVGQPTGGTSNTGGTLNAGGTLNRRHELTCSPDLDPRRGPGP